MWDGQRRTCLFLTCAWNHNVLSRIPERLLLPRLFFSTPRTQLMALVGHVVRCLAFFSIRPTSSVLCRVSNGRVVFIIMKPVHAPSPPLRGWQLSPHSLVKCGCAVFSSDLSPLCCGTHLLERVLFGHLKCGIIFPRDKSIMYASLSPRQSTSSLLPHHHHLWKDTRVLNTHVRTTNLPRRLPPLRETLSTLCDLFVLFGSV